MGIFSEESGKKATERFEKRTSLQIRQSEAARQANAEFRARDPFAAFRGGRRRSKLRFNRFISGALRRELNR